MELNEQEVKELLELAIEGSRARTLKLERKMADLVGGEIVVSSTPRRGRPPGSTIKDKLVAVEGKQADKSDKTEPKDSSEPWDEQEDDDSR